MITQVLSAAAVYSQYVLEAGGETIGVPGAELYEDGIPASYNPNTQGGPIPITISAAQLLGNDTWHGLSGAAAGLAISGVGNASHLGSLSLSAEGNVRLSLEANYNGAAGFDYTVRSPDGQTRTARVELNITAVNDAPSVTVVKDAARPVYGYRVQDYSYTVSSGGGEDGVTTTYVGATTGGPVYQPYVEEIRGPALYEDRVVGDGENGFSVERVFIGYGPSSYVDRSSPVDQETPNTGYISAQDPDGGGSFSFQLVGAPIYGTAAVDASTGRWSYLGKRPVGIEVEDVNGDGTRDWLDTDNGTVTLNMPLANTDSNSYGGNEQRFTDYFTVRVHDGGGGYTDKQIDATHYGPPPAAIVASSGGKKPIAIDLDGNGFAFTDVDDSNVFLDVNGDGWKRRSAWIKPGDGLLAFDRDGNGKIEGIDEIAFVGYAPDQQTDLAAVRKAFDTNNNGVLDAGDANWNQFGVWQDSNSNGIQEAGEFKSLTDMGINTIGLTSDGQFQVIHGQTVHGLASATRTDGSTLAVADVTLRYTNEAKLPAANQDGTPGSATVTVSKYGQGRQFLGTPDKDLVFGTAASDHFVTLDGDDVIVDDGGNDVVQAGAGNDLIYTGRDNDIMFAGAGSDTVFAGAGNDLVFGDDESGTGDDLIMMEDGNDVAFGGGGNDFISGGLGNDVLSGNAGDDKLFGEDGWDALLGLEGDDELWGGAGNDLLDGGAGNDLLLGGTGDDAMEGGTGDDIYEVDSAGDTIFELAGEGADTVNASISYTLADALENLTLTGAGHLSGTGNAADNVLVGNDGNNTLTGLAGSDVLDGGRGADLMMGGTGDDTYVVDHAGDRVIEAAGEGRDTVRSRISTTLSTHVENLTLIGINAIDATGNELDNVLVGNSAANVLDGGAGVDVMRGGRGNDTYIVDNASDSVIENASEGTDTVLASVSYTLSANVENLTLTGTADLSATGNELDNSLFGNAGSNTLDGAAGADVMVGGAGDDIYLVDNADDTVVEVADEGVETVLASVSYVLSANVENMILTGSAAIDATGNDLANTLIGNAGANRLDGRAGADVMAGGAGDDTYVVDNLLDTVTEQADEGIDTVLSSISYTLSSHVENLVLAGSASVDATGNTLNNTLTGNAGNNWIDGNLGADAMAGGAGDDIYGVDDAGDMVTEWFDAGTDTVLASISYVLPQHVENLRLTGRAITAAGNAMNNQLYGNALDNLLDGDAGADQMVGAAGDDTYVVDDAGDSVVERVDEGNDTVLAGVSHGLSDNVENLVLTGAADLAATGNNLNNVILGNAGNNLIDGGVGADVMAGGAGNDRYLVDDSLDIVTEVVAEGVDTIEAGVSYTLSSQVENLVLTGTAIEGVGNDLDNHLAGNTLDNLLDGAAGADVMAGGAGNDTYVVDNAADTIEELAGEGNDTVQSSVSYTLAANAENLLLTGTADLSATGNDLDNTLTGNAGNNVLNGGAGNDTYVYTMVGGLDTIIDTSGVDSVTFGPGLTLDNVALRIATVNGQKIADQGVDYVMSVDAQGRLTSALENFVFSDGRTYLWHDLLIQPTALIGANEADLLLGGRHDDSMYGRNDRDVLYGGSGHDQLFGESGDDILFGGGGSDRLYGGNGDDELHGEAGNDLLYGDNGNDLLIDLQGNNTFYGGNHDDVVMAGAGNDTIYSDLAQTGAGAAVISNGCDIVQAGAGVDRIDTGNENDLVDAGTGDDLIGGGNSDDWIAAGKGNDVIDGGNGRNLYAFNRGDGADLLSNSGNGRDTVSLGGSIRYADLSLAKAGNDLVLDMGQGDSMTLKNWYLGGNAKNVEKLQVVTVGGDYDATSTDKIRNQQVEVFDFSKLVQKFDAARAAGAVNANGWTVMNSLLDAHLQGSNTAALGGDLSYQYATAGSLSGIGLGAAQTSLAAGTDWQNLRSRGQLEQGSVKLM